MIESDEYTVGSGRGGRFLRVRWIRRRLWEIRLITTVDCVDCIIHCALHHREAQRRRWRGLPRGHDDCVRLNQIPVSDGICARDRCRREGDNYWYDQKLQDSYFFELS